MFDWPALLCTAAPQDDTPHLRDWFARIARQILLGSRLRASGKRFRPVEIEFYYHWSGHPDPFAHRDPIQVECGRWYFHRTHGAYRGGSFKGVDVTFGGGGTHGGVLFRAMETEAGTLIDGPSLLVDHLLAKTRQPDVASLVAAIAGRKVWDSKSPLALQAAPIEERPILQTARVGLSLKYAGNQPDRQQFAMRAYRFLTEPKRIAKGKPQMVLALYEQGLDVEDIYQRTRCPRKTVQRYIADYQAGKRTDFAAYIGKDLTPRLLCRLCGTWNRHYGAREQRE
jgi:hypothetical protein